MSGIEIVPFKHYSTGITGLVAVFDGRHYLSELGMRRAANMSRVLPAVIRSRHGAYLDTCSC